MICSYIKSDLYRYEGKWSMQAFAKNFLFNPSFKFTFWLRCCNGGGFVRIIGRILHRHYSIKYGLKIPHDTEIGYGFYIAHGLSVVVNNTCKIGNNVTLSQFCSIGATKGKAAEIGDNVYIGPNVSIVEHVLIGDNVSVGAGAVVTKSIPRNATVAGVPAKVLHFKNPGRFILYKSIAE